MMAICEHCAMLCYAKLCYIMLCYTMLYYVMLTSTENIRRIITIIIPYTKRMPLTLDQYGAGYCTVRYCTCTFFLLELLEQGLGLAAEAAEAETLAEVGAQQAEAQVLGRLPQVLLELLQPHVEQRQQGTRGGQRGDTSEHTTPDTQNI